MWETQLFHTIEDDSIVVTSLSASPLQDLDSPIVGQGTFQVLLGFSATSPRPV